MKKHKHPQNVKRKTGSKIKSEHVNEMLKMCLVKVCELQQELNKQDDLEEDPQAAGYAACAIETLKFLSKEGLPKDHPMVKILTEKLSPSENR